MQAISNIKFVRAENKIRKQCLKLLKRTNEQKYKNVTCDINKKLKIIQIWKEKIAIKMKCEKL